MKSHEMVSPGQMGILLFAFMTGSSIIYVPGILIGFAHNGAWLSLVITNIVSLLLLGCVLHLYHKYPGMSFVQYSRKTLGGFLLVVITVPFTLYLILMISWITQGVGGFMISTGMNDTPAYIFHSLILVTAAMTVRAGFEVMTRVAILQICILSFFIFSILILSTWNFHLEFMKPMFPEGIKPVLHGSYFTFGFPHAEVVVFTMVLSYARIKKSSSLNKFMIIALLLNGLLLITSTLSTILVFGPIAADIKYSLFGISRLVDIGDFFQRIESVVGISLLAGSYIKATVALFALNLMLSQLFKLKDEQILVYPITLICFLLSLVMFDSETEFNEKFIQVLPLINLTCGTLPVLLVTFVSLFKKSNR